MKTEFPVPENDNMEGIARQEENANADAEIDERAEQKASNLVFSQAEQFEKNSVASAVAEEHVQNNLWDYVKKIGAKLGKAALDAINYLWEVMKNPEIPIQAKLIAISALLYFINPIDFVPDVIPFFGFTDDAAALAAAVTSITYIIHIHEESKKQKEIGESN